ncbi:MAG: hypothetical protein KF856_06990 [Cyclobacteriaceae bacterium]|nr:hypothetical protein [Cyclobacteriaceae bacterium]MBX2915000.1 hypothetical protein [Cyclobacteriaceae bacterium]
MKDNQTGKPEQPDFYWENGLLVFTEAYHLKRGYCCSNGCRHCPYKNKKAKSNREKPL